MGRLVGDNTPTAFSFLSIEYSNLIFESCRKGVTLACKEAGYTLE